MTAFLISIGVVALAEIGDKTQLLALALAAKYRKPWPIILGILFATLANHFLAGAVGTWLTVPGRRDAWALGLSFIAMALWMLVPTETVVSRRPFGVSARR
jgi:putative Ca2+/H+ antiporter (TMEM165/GDT1 family)